jgi:hypothetical protein
MSIEPPVSIKVELKTELPPEASGRTLDAITDLLRPISEGLGFLGDKIQLQRQKTLLEIAKRSKERLEVLQKPIRPIPMKFFLPLLEKASLEDMHDDTLINMWANLIATAATDEVQMLGQYANVLSNVVPKQVSILEKMFALNEENGAFDAGHLIDNYYYLNQTGLPGTLDQYAQIKNAEKFSEAVVGELNIKGVAIDTINIFYAEENRDGDFSVSSPDNIYTDRDFLDFENLVRLGLIDRTEIKKHRIGIFDIDVHYYVTTPVGIDLYACCNPKKLSRSN